MIQEQIADREGQPDSPAAPLVVTGEAPVYGGYVIVRGEKVIFVKGAVPGELVEVSIHEKKKDYLLASVRNILEPSPFRRTPPCPIFGICGGCQLQYIEYNKQITMKEEILLDALRRIGDVSVTLSPSLVGAEFGYRHRAQFKVSSGGEIGFYREGSREVVPVEKCPLMVDKINDVLREIKAMNLAGVREAHISAGDTVTVLIKGHLADDTAQRMLEAGVSGVALESGDSMGRDYVTLPFFDLKYSVTPWSFFQSNWALNRALVELVRERLATLEDKRVLDLYAGAGNFALPLALDAREVTAVEENQHAVEDGRRNVMMNGIKTCTFVHLPVEKCFETGKKNRASRLFGETHYDVIILDPPRTGLTSDFLRRIVEAGSERIVYVSCNPATLARDIKKMKEKYEVDSVHMADFFPNTYHIEAAVFLNKK